MKLEQQEKVHSGISAIKSQTTSFSLKKHILQIHQICIASVDFGY